MLLFVWVFLCVAYCLFPCGFSVILNSTPYLYLHFIAESRPHYFRTNQSKTQSLRHLGLDFTRHTISSPVPGLSFDDFPYVVAVALERVWVKKPGKENNIKSNVEISRVKPLQPTGSEAMRA